MTDKLPSQRRFYLDSSAWLAGMLGQPGGAAIAAEVAEGELVSSVLLVVEVNRNLARLAREGALTAAQLQSAIDRFETELLRFDLHDLTLELARDREMPVVTTPSSLDLVHLRTALRYHRERPLTRFISLDEGQVRAARELGLPV